MVETLFSYQRDYGRQQEESFFFGSGRAKCLQAVVQFGGATEAGGEDIYWPSGCDDLAL